MRLIHYSNQYLSEVRSVEQPDPEGDVIGRGHRCDKPLGLWLSVEGEDDWAAWCKAEQFNLSALSHPTEIVLHPNANILRLDGADALRAFNETYKCRPWYADKIREDNLFEGMAIRWRDVASEHDGIIIAPYVWELRLDLNVRWYYGWDCASGCIWNNRAVAELRQLPCAAIERSDA